MNPSMPGLPVHHQLPESTQPMSIESVMPSNHLIFCHPLLLLSSIFPSIRVFSNESALRIRWPKYWSFSFSISPSNEHPGLISFRRLVGSPCSPRDSQESSPTPQFKSINSLVLSFLLSVQLSHPYMTTGKPIALTRWTFVDKVMSLLCYNFTNVVESPEYQTKWVAVGWCQFWGYTNPGDYFWTKCLTGACLLIIYCS